MGVVLLGCGIVVLKLHCAVRFWVIGLVGDGDGEGVKLDGADSFARRGVCC